MKSILVPMEEHVLIQSVLKTGLMLGRALDGYMEGMAITPNMPSSYASDITIGAIGDISFLDPEVRRRRSEASRRLFETFMAAQGVPRPDTGPTGLCFGWRLGELKEDDFVGHYGRAFDITVLGRPSDQANHPRPPTVEAALFESGRPVLIAPPTPPETFGATVVIAWNRSTETARTVALAMPLLAKAHRIIVIDLEDWGVSGPSTRELRHTLNRNGLPVEIRTVPNPNGHAGEAILSAARSMGCDLLVKGAYTQSRLRQFIFGGATSHILSNTTVPVLMAH
ncbi:universal stress protein [Microvirga brassicacearum]|uniref:Universal stress protein n=1 Tax=Microvirga brassicacearum TaxID=2580413 RepID=A0A5N3P970_9HYPH|nr:universal stress protein [Microvirga brassicacearum]KAB0266282.1 universal stress protein [Microvirga brassicacearum]